MFKVEDFVGKPKIELIDEMEWDFERRRGRNTDYFYRDILHDYPSLRNDRDIVKAAIRYDNHPKYNPLSCMNKRFTNDKGIIWTALRYRGVSRFASASDNIKNDRKFVMDAINKFDQKNFEIYRELSDNLKHDEEIIKKSISYRSHKMSELKDVFPDDLFNDKEFVELIFRNTKCDLNFDELTDLIPKKLFEDKGVVDSMLYYTTDTYTDVDFNFKFEEFSKLVSKECLDEFFNDEDIVLQLLRRDVNTYSYLPDDLKTNGDLMIKFMDEYDRDFKCYDLLVDELKQNKDFMHSVAKLSHGYNRDKSHIKNDPYFKQAVDEDNYHEYEIKHDPIEYYHLQPDEIRCDPDIALEYIESCWEYEDYSDYGESDAKFDCDEDAIPEKLKADKDFALKAIEVSHGHIYHCLSRELKCDEDIVAKTIDSIYKHESSYSTNNGMNTGTCYYVYDETDDIVKDLCSSNSKAYHTLEDDEDPNSEFDDVFEEDDGTVKHIYRHTSEPYYVFDDNPNLVKMIIDKYPEIAKNEKFCSTVNHVATINDDVKKILDDEKDVEKSSLKGDLLKRVKQNADAAKDNNKSDDKIKRPGE